MGKKVREMYGEGGSGCTRRGVSLYLSFFRFGNDKNGVDIYD